MTYFRHGIEELVEEDEDLSLGNLGDVVHALAGKVAHLAVRVVEAGEDGGDDVDEKGGDAGAESDAGWVSGVRDGARTKRPRVP